MNQNNVPVTLIAGFLGSGKTTLLNHLLRSYWDNEQIGIIVNDFGKVSLDDQLIEKRTNDILSLRNGCVCCSLVSDLQRTIEKLTDEIGVKAIVMEASGVADPLQMRTIFQDNGFLKDRVFFNTVVTVIDASSYQRFVNEILMLRDQTEAASLLLLNKTDLVDKRTLGQIEQLLRSQNPHALIIRTFNAKVEPRLIFRHGGSKVSSDRSVHKHQDDHKHESDNKNDNLRLSFKGLEVFLYESKHPIDRDKFERIAANLPNDLYRSKGVVFLSGHHQPLLFQYVPAQFSIEKPQANTISASKTQIVFIGRETIDRDSILKQLHAAETK
jgi:G3E family GTPase